MKIFFEQIKLDGKQIDTSFEFNVDDITFFIKHFIGKIYPVKKGYILDGDIELSITDKCDRCLKEFNENFHERITVEIVNDKPSEEIELELEDEDMGYYIVKEDFVNIHEILYQESLLIRPIKRLCSVDCKGICPNCGRDLNVEQCNCSKDTDERWNALTKFLQNNK
ncbi:MAG: DUF177 domain-containing protein [Deferribacterales bacterium]